MSLAHVALPNALSTLAEVKTNATGGQVFRTGSAAQHVHFLAERLVALSGFGSQGEPVAMRGSGR